MGIMAKLLFAVAIVSTASAVACHKTHAAPKNISASSDAKGSHPATTAVDGPVEVTCVSATDDRGGTTPPACVIAGPGTSGVVDIGHKVAVTASGDVTLTCQGKGTLACTAEIRE